MVIQSLCDFNKDIAQEVDAVLFQYWTDGYGDVPVVILKNVDTGDGKYQKETFVQSFTFSNGLHQGLRFQDSPLRRRRSRMFLGMTTTTPSSAADSLCPIPGL